MISDIILRPSSLPLRKCGLKFISFEHHVKPLLVTSLAEVWIEIHLLLHLKSKSSVTSLAEVWIEIPNSVHIQHTGCVTSLAEVWIEILANSISGSPISSLPLRKCGLKYQHFCIVIFLILSLPLRKCGLKYLYTDEAGDISGHFPCGSVD